MVGVLYNAKEFYELQRKGKVAKNMDSNKKLFKKSNGGYYLKKSNSKGLVYTQEVKANSKVYSRSEGVTMYSKSLDKDIKSSYKKEGTKKHSKYAHMSDRASLTSDKKYKV